MNKKFLFGMFAAATMLFATSCSDELDSDNVGNMATVSFNLGVEDGVQSRVISDGLSADKLVYAVFDEDGVRISGIEKVTKENVTFPTEVTITLAKGQTYKVAFWAQDTDCKAYTISDDMKVSVNYAGLNNDETRDAFFKTEEFTVNGNASINVTLKRPFAQLNVGVYDDDWNAAVASGVEIGTSKVVIKNAATSINLIDGSVSGKTEVTYDFAAIPKAQGEVLSVDLDGDGTKESYNYLSMSYILVDDDNSGSEKATLEGLAYTFHPQSGNDIEFNEGLVSVPVQRNWRTNIIGKILTGDITFTIKIDPVYDGEYNGLPFEQAKGVKLGESYFTTIAEALKVAKENDVIELTAGKYDLTKETTEISNNITIRAAEGIAAKDVMLKGTVKMKKGTLKDVTLYGTEDGGNLLNSAFYGDCTIEGVIFDCPSTGTVNAFKEYASLGDGNKYNLTFKNCTFKANGQRPLQFDIMNVVVENCTFDNPYRYIVQIGEYANGCNLVFKNNNVVNYGSTKKEFYTYVQIADEGAAKNNVVTLEGNTQETEDEAAAKVWQDFVVENTESNAKIILKDANGVYYQNGAYNVETVDGMKWFANEINVKRNAFAGQTLKLANDLDFNGVNWEPLNLWFAEKNVIAMIDGNGKKISNLAVKGGTNIGFIGNYASTSELIIKNLTFDAPVIESTGNHLGVVFGQQYGSVVMNNVKVTNANLTSTASQGQRIGALIGFSPSDAKAYKLVSCVVENSTFTGFQNLGGLVGCSASAESTMTGCVSKNNIFYYKRTTPGTKNESQHLFAWHDFDSNGYAEAGGSSTKDENCTTEGNVGISYVADGVEYRKNSDEEGAYHILSAEGMRWFSDAVNIDGTTFDNDVLKLDADIDLEGVEWKPIGQTGQTGQFKGEFDGQNYTIKNLNINSNAQTGASYSSGLFGWLEQGSPVVKNVKVDGATVIGHHNVAVIAGYVYGTIENCHVANATLKCTNVNDDANGDKCGTIAGYVGEDAKISKCTAAASKIEAGRDAGQIVGAAKSACVTDCSATDVTVSANGTGTGANIRNEVIGRVL